MAGENIRRLYRTAAGMSPTEVSDSAETWRNYAKTLDDVSRTIDRSRKGISAGYGEGTYIATEAIAVLDRLKKVVDERKKQMQMASQEPSTVSDETVRVNGTILGTPTAPPSEAPDPMKYGPTRLPDYYRDSRAHDQHVQAYGEADERARKQVEAVNTAHDNAIAVLMEIHGEPDAPKGDGPGGDGPGGPGSTPRSPIRHDDGHDDHGNGHNDHDSDHDDNDHDHDHDHDNDNDHDNDHDDNDHGTDDNGTDDNGTDHGTDDDGTDHGTDDTGHGTDPSDPSGDHGGHGSGWPNPLSNPGAMVGAGVLGGLGTRGLMGAMRPSINVPGQHAAHAIGSHGRGAGGSSVLGRGGASAPGQAVGRGSAGAGAAGRGGMGTGGGVGRGNGGRGAGGRGAGGRGAVGAAGGRGDRKKDQREGEQDHYEADEDWTEDDGQFPGVID